MSARYVYRLDSSGNRKGDMEYLLLDVLPGSSDGLLRLVLVDFDGRIFCGDASNYRLVMSKVVWLHE